jgi:ribonuclease HI
MSVLYIYFDGASRNNPGPAGAGIYITQNDTVLFKQGFFLESKTNNQAEYLAFLLALFVVEKILNLNAPMRIFSDSELLVCQITGNYRIKNEIIAKIKTAIDPLLENKKYTITHILREKNQIADKLANQGINKKISLPPEFTKYLERHDIAL